MIWILMIIFILALFAICITAYIVLSLIFQIFDSLENPDVNRDNKLK